MTMSSIEATTDRSTAAASSAQQPARLTRQQRDQILDAALAHASAVQAHTMTFEEIPQQLGLPSVTRVAATVESTRQELQNLLNRLTTTSVNTALLDRTIERDSLLDEVGTLKDALAASNRAAEERSAELQRLQDRLDHATDGAEALRVFKQKVVGVADQYAQEHGWCQVIDQALEDLGLERAPKEYRAKLTITCAKCSEVLPYRDLDSGRGTAAVDSLGAMYCNDDDSAGAHTVLTAGIGDDAVITTKIELTSEFLAASRALKTVGARATFLDAMADYERALRAMGAAAAALPVLPAGGR